MTPSLARSLAQREPPITVKAGLQRASITANSIATIRTEALECPFVLLMCRVGNKGPLFERQPTLATHPSRDLHLCRAMPFAGE